MSYYWHSLNSSVDALADENGKIVAEISGNHMSGWFFGAEKYVTRTAAKTAAENSVLSGNFELFKARAAMQAKEPQP